MPYKLRKAPRRELYWVVTKATGMKHSLEPLTYDHAVAQMKALYAREKGYPPKKGGMPPRKNLNAEANAQHEQRRAQQADERARARQVLVTLQNAGLNYDVIVPIMRLIFPDYIVETVLTEYLAKFPPGGPKPPPPPPPPPFGGPSSAFKKPRGKGNAYEGDFTGAGRLVGCALPDQNSGLEFPPLVSGAPKITSKPAPILAMPTPVMPDVPLSKHLVPKLKSIRKLRKYV